MMSGNVGAAMDNAGASHHGGPHHEDEDIDSDIDFDVDIDSEEADDIDEAVDIAVALMEEEEAQGALSLVTRPRDGAHQMMAVGGMVGGGGNGGIGGIGGGPIIVHQQGLPMDIAEPSDLSMNSRLHHQYSNSPRSASINSNIPRNLPMELLERVAATVQAAASGGAVMRGEANVQELLRARQRTEAVNVAMAMGNITLPQPMAVVPSTSGVINLHRGVTLPTVGAVLGQQGPINYSTVNPPAVASGALGAASSSSSA